MNTDFDLDRLQYELNALKVEDFDLSLTGFGEYEIENLLSQSEEIDLDEFVSDEEKKPKEKRCPHCGELL